MAEEELRAVDAGEELSSTPALRYRDHSRSGPRSPRGVLRYSDVEFAVIERASAAEGWQPRPWVQHVALERALRSTRPGNVSSAEADVLRAELREARRVFNVAGGNLNDLARVANSTGELPAEEQFRELRRFLDQAAARMDAVAARLVRAAAA